MSEKRIRILLVDDHLMLVRGLAATLAPESDMEVAGTAANGPQALERYRDLRPDVTIMDLRLTPEMDGAQATRAIRKEFPDARIIIVSMHKGEADIFQAMEAGAITYLLKDTLGDNLVSVVREVYSGGKPIPAEVALTLADRAFEPHLTSREVEVVGLLAKGMRNKEIAGRLDITVNTVQGHLKKILYKLQVTDRAGAIAAAIRRGILHIND